MIPCGIRNNTITRASYAGPMEPGLIRGHTKSTYHRISFEIVITVSTTKDKEIGKEPSRSENMTKRIVDSTRVVGKGSRTDWLRCQFLSAIDQGSFSFKLASAAGKSLQGHLSGRRMCNVACWTARVEQRPIVHRFIHCTSLLPPNGDAERPVMKNTQYSPDGLCNNTGDTVTAHLSYFWRGSRSKATVESLSLQWVVVLNGHHQP